MKMAIRAAKNAPSVPARQALNPSAVDRSRAGPKIRLRAGLAPSVIDRCARLARSGNTHAYASTDDADSAVMSATHGAIFLRS